MIVIFRADASIRIGTGHVMRCLTLASMLKEAGHGVSFICRQHEGNLIDFIRIQGFEVYALESREEEAVYSRQLAHAEWLGTSQEEDAEVCRRIVQGLAPDWLIVDHYAIDTLWETALIDACKKLMVIDDLGDRKHRCDLLLDQNYKSRREKYASLVPEQCQILAGSEYALLRPEFAKWREYSLTRRANPELKRLLITLGGTDSDNMTGKILDKLSCVRLPEDLEITVIMGATAPHAEAVKQRAASMPWKTLVFVNVGNMAEIMADADLAIGAAGATTWERCCLGLPTIQTVIAENQREIARLLAEDHVIKVLQTLDQLPGLMETAADWMVPLGRNASGVCDGLGAQKVLKELL